MGVAYFTKRWLNPSHQLAIKNEIEDPPFASETVINVLNYGVMYDISHYRNGNSVVFYSLWLLND